MGGWVKSLRGWSPHHRRFSHSGIFFVSDGIPILDMFGHPVVPRSGGRGRPEHIWTLENSNRVLLSFARGLSVKQTAMVVGVSAPTLRKVYFSEVARRANAQVLMEMTQLARLNNLATAGNVTAEKELMKQMDRLRQRDEVRAMAPPPSNTSRPDRLGKKESAAKAAEQVRGLYEPPPAPGRMN